jgi:hypothetical protein
MNPLEFNLPWTRTRTKCWIKPAQPQDLDHTDYEVYINNKLAANIYVDQYGHWQQANGQPLQSDNINYLGSKVENFLGLMRNVYRLFDASAQNQTQESTQYSGAETFRPAMSM